MTARSPWNREEAARAEIARTAVRPAVARVLVAVFLAGIVAIIAVDRTGARRHAFRDLAAGLARAARVIQAEGLFAGNAALHAALTGFEDTLEENSRFAALVLPPTRALLAGILGEGNDEVVRGRAGELVYRPDLDLITSPGFLAKQLPDPRANEGWPREQRAADPIKALTEFRLQLARRGIILVVVPVPGKPAIEPEAVVSSIPVRDLPLRNPSLDRFLAALEATGSMVFDCSPQLLALRRRIARPVYLATDSHWTPEAVEEVAGDLARVIAPFLGKDPERPALYTRSETTVANLGDLAVMLRLPSWQRLFPPEKVTIHPVLAGDGSPWRLDPAAEVLVLGDSYANVYSLGAMGWGEGAGLAEQLSYALGRPVDRIAINAGGAWTARASLARELAQGRERLAGKKVVVYEFAARELGFGDWRSINLPLVTGSAQTTAPAGLVVSGRIAAVAALPRATSTPYREALIGLRLDQLRPAAAGAIGESEIVVYAWVLRDGVWTETGRLRPGTRVRLTLVPWAEVADRLGSIKRFELDDDRSLLLPAYFAADIANE